MSRTERLMSALEEKDDEELLGIRKGRAADMAEQILHEREDARENFFLMQYC